ncbi:MAG: serine hydrolase [Minicystis sp.]
MPIASSTRALRSAVARPAAARTTARSARPDEAVDSMVASGQQAPGRASWPLRALLAAACAGAIACAAATLPESGKTAPRPTAAPTTIDAASAPPPKCTLGDAGPDGATTLGTALLSALRNARFDQVIDLSPTADPSCARKGRCRPAPIARMPSVDVAVIAFAPGCPPVFANALLAHDLPAARLNHIDPTTLAVRGVRFRRWDQARWDAKGPHMAPSTTADDDIVPPRPGEPNIDFAVPYPASNFKLLVAVAIMDLVDRGLLRLDDTFAHGTQTRTTREWLADMITWSDDESTQAMIRQIHALGAADRLNTLFERLGLATLQIHDTSPDTGRNWQPGRIHMTAWDTARLLWLLDPDAPPPTWRTPSGAPVDAKFLSVASKRLLLDLLGEQAFHDVLSTAALCGAPRTSKGIPALLPQRWMGEDGHVRLDGTARNGDARPCNAAAEVTFAHKTGLTQNFGSDAGIVRGIPGRARRHYIITFFSNLGHRYTDADKASGPDPCHDLGICYTQRIASLGAAIDGVIESAIEEIPATR